MYIWWAYRLFQVYAVFMSSEELTTMPLLSATTHDSYDKAITSHIAYTTYGGDLRNFRTRQREGTFTHLEQSQVLLIVTLTGAHEGSRKLSKWDFIQITSLEIVESKFLTHGFLLLESSRTYEGTASQSEPRRDSWGSELATPYWLCAIEQRKVRRGSSFNPSQLNRRVKITWRFLTRNMSKKASTCQQRNHSENKIEIIENLSLFWKHL